MQEMEKKGHLNPVSQVIFRVAEIFKELGFAVADGPEIETEFYNFDALNIPADHPARDMWDTFWLKPEGSQPENSNFQKPNSKLLRTHTSPVQVRYMQANKPPLRIIAPGKTFRYEATDATHEAQFYQIEGLMVDKDVSVATMKATLEYFLEKLFEQDVEIRLRPSFFPFVEPGFEIDMSCFKCGGSGEACSVCKGTGWVEIMGAGMVHPNVFKAVGIDSQEFRGFAFGCGADRLAMLKFGIDDIRQIYGGDVRFINQF